MSAVFFGKIFYKLLFWNKKTRKNFQKTIDKYGKVCYYIIVRCAQRAGVAELADAQDLKSCGINFPYRFDPGFRHH